MASTEDARAGWELYRNSGFSLSGDEINQRLVALGYSPVRPRTLDHFQRLRRRGFRRYISINRLDTMAVPDPFVDESIRSRYGYADANVPTQLVVNQPTGPIEVTGGADSLSDFGTEIVVTDPAQLTALRAQPPLPKTPTTVYFLKPATTAYGTIDFVSVLDPNEVRIDIVFQRLVPAHELLGGQPLDMQLFRFIVGGEDQPPLDVVSKDLYWLVQAVEAARGVVNLLLDSLSQGVVAAPPAVDHLAVGSPMDAWLRFSVHVYQTLQRMRELVEMLGPTVGGVVRSMTQRPIVDAEAEVMGAEAELIRAQADNVRAQTEGLRVDNRRRDVLVTLTSEVAAALINDLQARGRKVNAAPNLNLDRLSKLLFSDLEPSVRELEMRGLEAGHAPENDDNAS